jgi:hypothetical protein
MIIRKLPIKYNKSLLDKTLAENRGELIGWLLEGTSKLTIENPEKLNRNVEIHYKCNCSVVYKKNFRLIVKHGAYCISCQKKITSNKMKEILTKWTASSIKEAVERLQLSLGYTSMEDWYKISQADFNNNGLEGLLVGTYGGSPIRCLLSVYPEYPWNIILFKTKPQGFWNDTSNAILALQYISKTKGWNSIDDLYNISRKDIEENCSGLWHKFSSIIDILRYSYPTTDWNITRLNRIPDNTFDNIENHKEVLHNLEKGLGIKEPIEWFDHLTYEIFISCGYSNLLKRYYNDSPSEFILTMYPFLRDKIHMLKKAPQNYYEDHNNIKGLVNNLASDYEILLPDDWYNITCRDIQKYIGTGIERWGGIIDFIIKFVDVPEGFVWDRSKFVKYKTEAKLSSYLEKKGIKHTSQSKYDWLKNTNNKYYRFDEELSELRIMLELDGPQHFKLVWKYRNPEETMKADIIKMKKASENGYSGIRLYQPDVLDDSVDWKGFIDKAINYIKLSNPPIWVFPKKDVYKTHIDMCLDNNINYIILE